MGSPGKTAFALPVDEFFEKKIEFGCPLISWPASICQEWPRWPFTQREAAVSKPYVYRVQTRPFVDRSFYVGSTARPDLRLDILVGQLVFLMFGGEVEHVPAEEPPRQITVQPRRSTGRRRRRRTGAASFQPWSSRL
jgi:hypothetical protein